MVGAATRCFAALGVGLGVVGLGGLSYGCHPGSRLFKSWLLTNAKVLHYYYFLPVLLSFPWEGSRGMPRASSFLLSAWEGSLGIPIASIFSSLQPHPLRLLVNLILYLILLLTLIGR